MIINGGNVKWEIERGDGKFILILFIEQSSTRSTDWFVTLG